mgnify:CR=1 FL=1
MHENDLGKKVELERANEMINVMQAEATKRDVRLTVSMKHTEAAILKGSKKVEALTNEITELKTWVKHLESGGQSISTTPVKLNLGKFFTTNKKLVYALGARPPTPEMKSWSVPSGRPLKPFAQWL